MDLLAPLQPAAYRFILVDDRDGLLDDEAARAELLARGYRLIADDGDPVRLRHEVGPPDAGVSDDGRPLIILTRRPLNELPYDWWAAAHRLTLRLAEQYPQLNPTVLRELTGVEQRWRLSRAAPPSGRLGREATADYLLHAVFEADLAALGAPAALVTWLARLHHDLPGPLPPALRARLLTRLATAPALVGWPLAELLDDPAAFGRFVTGQWAGYLSRATGEPLGETAPVYRLDFAGDAALQDTLPLLARRGVLPRLAVREVEQLPPWAAPGVVAAAGGAAAGGAAAGGSAGDGDPRSAADDLLARLDEQAGPLLARPDAARWATWAAVARTWAELTGLALGARDEVIAAAVAGWRARLDPAFAAWLRRGYAALAGAKLPQPHHVHHVPHLMAYERRRDGRPVTLLVLDGLSLADWLRIGRVWRARHPGWQIDERPPLLAQIPTITAVSRQALVGGRPRAAFAASLGHNSREPAHWAAFWAAEGLVGRAVAYAHLSPGVPLPPPAQALCLITTGLDSRLHSATQGAAEVWASLGVWLDGGGRAVEAVIDELLAAGHAVTVTSDHGYVEAWGMGRPREGEAASSRGQRSRLYRTRETAEAQRSKFPKTSVWPPDGLLPPDVWTLLPTDQDDRLAFADAYRQVMAHGGLTLDEVVVPLARITKG